MTPLPAEVFWKSAITCLLAVFITEKPTTLTLPFVLSLLLLLAGSEQAAVATREAVTAAGGEPPQGVRVRVVDRVMCVAFRMARGQRGRAGRGPSLALVQ